MWEETRCELGDGIGDGDGRRMDGVGLGREVGKDG
jgi:hypothetical protein